MLYLNHRVDLVADRDENLLLTIHLMLVLLMKLNLYRLSILPGKLIY